MQSNGAADIWLLQTVAAYREHALAAEETPGRSRLQLKKPILVKWTRWTRLEIVWQGGN